MTIRRLACTLLVLTAACGGADGPEFGMSIRGLASVPQATQIDIQLHPSERTCAALHDSFILGARLPGVTGTDVAIDTRLLFGSILDGVYTVTAVAHDNGFSYGDACRASVELKVGEVTEITLEVLAFPTPVGTL